MTITIDHRNALANLASAQEAFWHAITAFETLTETELSSHVDYTGYTEPDDEDVQEVIDTYGNGESEEGY